MATSIRDEGYMLVIPLMACYRLARLGQVAGYSIDLWRSARLTSTAPSPEPHAKVRRARNTPRRPSHSRHAPFWPAAVAFEGRCFAVPPLVGTGGCWHAWGVVEKSSDGAMARCLCLRPVQGNPGTKAMRGFAALEKGCLGAPYRTAAFRLVHSPETHTH